MSRKTIVITSKAITTHDHSRKVGKVSALRAKYGVTPATANLLINQSIKQTNRQTNNNQSVNKPINQSTSQTINQS